MGKNFNQAIAFIDAELAAGAFSGAALRVVRKGETLLERYWGTSCSFGLGTVTSPRTFGHAGISTVMAVGEPDRQAAPAFITSDAPNLPGLSTARIRNAVTDLVMGEM
jgi:hypothetical protein